MSNKVKLPVTCPSCEEQLYVSALSCSNCDTSIAGRFELPPIMKLNREEQEFVFQFVLNSGSIKNMAAQMKLSYPTVRNVLDNIIEKLNRQ